MENTYIKGLYFNKVHPNTPEEVKKWKKGRISIHAEKLVEWIKNNSQHINEQGYINADLTQNEKDGEKFYSVKVDTWKPEAKDSITKANEANDVAANDITQAEIEGQDIPF